MNKTDYRNARPDHQPGHRQEYERNKKRILARDSICGICGQPVDRNYKYPHPLSPTIDHIIPVSRGGHPSDISNLQLAHMRCNRQKADRLQLESIQALNSGNGSGNNKSRKDPTGNNVNRSSPFPGSSAFPYGLPFTIDWEAYRYSDSDNRSNSDDLQKKAEAMRAKGFVLTSKGVLMANTLAHDP